MAEAIPLIAANAYTRYKVLPGVVGSTPFSEQYAEEWHRLSAQPYSLAMAECIYQLEKVNPVTGVPGYLRKAAEKDKQLLSSGSQSSTRKPWEKPDTSRLASLVDRLLSFETQGMFIWEDEIPV